MHTLHVIVFNILKFFVKPWFAISGTFKCRTATLPPGGNIILTNHNTNWDFLYFGSSFKGHMYFVASEHIFRLGFKSKLIKTFLDPIPRKKGASAISTTKEILKRLKSGYNICMMAEGNRSFSGETGFIFPGTASLVKKAGAGLTTYRLHGAYLVNPRWSKEVRKGPIWGEVVNQYTAEQVKAMTREEIDDIINRDLYVDAFEDQEEKHYEYRAKAPAEDLETALFACPDCGSFASLRSSGDKIVCSKCGSEHIFSKEGFFVKEDGSAPAFSTILDWSNWQKQHLNEYISSLPDGSLIRTDQDASLYFVHPLEGKQLVLKGTISLYKDRLEFVGAGDSDIKRTFSIHDIKELAVILINTMLFTAGEEYYEVRLPQKASALHYMISYFTLSGREYKR